jgi:hypothetical protein
MVALSGTRLVSGAGRQDQRMLGGERSQAQKIEQATQLARSILKRL